MKSETRNPNQETSPLYAALTPSEVAALLGPCVIHAGEKGSVAVEVCTSRWNSFAEDFTRRLTARLRPLIRAAVRVTFSSSSTLTAENLTASTASGEVVSLWQSGRSLEPLAIILSVPLVASFVDRLLGGRSAPNCDELELHRPLTEVDQRLASRLNEAVCRSMSEAVELKSPLELTELPDSANSLFEAWLSDCPLVRLTFDLQFVQGGGALDLLLPSEIAESLMDQLKAAESKNPSIDRVRIESPIASPPRSLVVAQLSQTSVSKNDLQSLAVGDVLLMPSPLDQSVQVFVDGHRKFSGIAGISDGRKAIRLTKADSESGL